MKHLTVMFFLLPFLMQAQNVGIGTTTPQTNLHIIDNFPILRLETNDGLSTGMQFGRTENGTFLEDAEIRSTGSASNNTREMEFILKNSFITGMELRHTDFTPGQDNVSLNLRHPDATLSTGDILSLDFRGASGSFGQLVAYENFFQLSSPASVFVHSGTGTGISMHLQGSKNRIIVDTTYDVVNTDPDVLFDVNGQFEANSLIIKDGAQSGYFLQSDNDGEASWAPIESNLIQDADNDTKIQVEESADEDIIRIDVGGIQVATYDQKGFRLDGPGNGIFIGQFAGESVTSGFNNVAIGQNAATKVTSAHSNISVGISALANNILGDNNVAIGTSAGALDNKSTNNVYIGHRSGGASVSLHDKQENTFVGAFAGETSQGSGNTFLGANAGQITTTQNDNTFVGFAAGQAAASSQNVLVGKSAGGGNTNSTGKNVMIGYESGQNSSGSDNVFIGNESGQTETGSNLLIIQNSAADNPLIYGEFDNNVLVLDGTVRISELVRLKPLSSPPGCTTSAHRGQVYYDDGANKLRVCTNSGWVNLH